MALKDRPHHGSHPGAAPQVAFLGGPQIVYREERPPAALAPWIAAIWRLRAYEDSELRILPDTCMDLIRGDVVGAFTVATVVHLRAGTQATGIRLRPGAFPALFGIPASEFVDLRVPLADIGRRTSLAELMRDAAPPDPCVVAALRARSVRELARETGYSPRHLHRRLIAATGHGAKRLARVRRMQAVLRAGRGESWARTAVEHGYYDEAHMANDVRELAGATPHALVGHLATS